MQNPYTQPQYHPPQQQYVQPQVQQVQMNAMKQVPAKRDPKFYKAVNEGQKHLTNAKKQLKYGITEEAAHHLRLACDVLAPYDEIKYDVPKKGQGMDPTGPAF
jgi:hypothetical protein